MKKKVLRCGTALLALLACFPTTAHAYFDPGSGSMILQMLGVAFIAMSGVFFAFKTRIMALFGKKLAKDADEDELDDEDDELGEDGPDDDGSDDAQPTAPPAAPKQKSLNDAAPLQRPSRSDTLH